MGSKPKGNRNQNWSKQMVYQGNLKLTLEGEFRNLEALVRALAGRDDRSIANQGVVNTWVGDQVGLELVQIDVKGTIEAKRGGD